LISGSLRGAQKAGLEAKHFYTKEMLVGFESGFIGRDEIEGCEE
jgi:hypothetical protein